MLFVNSAGGLLVLFFAAADLLTSWKTGLTNPLSSVFSRGAVERRHIEVGNDVAHCACHCKVNSPGSLLVSEACYMFCWEPGGPVPHGWGFLHVRWLVVRANPVENRNVFCHGIEGGGAREMRPAPRSQSSMCTRRDSLILSQTHGGKKKKKKAKSRAICSKDFCSRRWFVKSCEHMIETEKKFLFFFFFFPEALLPLIHGSLMHAFIL